ncbi:MAG: cytosolic protein [Kiritimatiellae bacterium]|nr:cytosolic protein [Kiritimatiellia bacterium]
MPDCPNVKTNRSRCNCTYDPCPRKGKCCECLHYHLAMKQLPGCCFPDNVEKTYDRSFKRFAQLYG